MEFAGGLCILEFRYYGLGEWQGHWCRVGNEAQGRKNQEGED